MRRLLCLLLLLPSFALAAPAAGLRGMVSTAHPAASEAGVEALRAGGNAVDAAGASAFALAVVEPYSSGLGGGGFALVRRGGELHFLDFREVAPAATTAATFLRDGKPDPALSQAGPLSAGVPGAVAGYLELHERFGKLPRAKVLARAIALAERGFLVELKYRDFVAVRLPLLARDPVAARIFLVPGKDGPEAPPVGHRLLQPELAATLRALARDGARAFYTGAVAKKLAADMKSRGGNVTAADLAAYRVRERQPLVGSYRGKAIVTSPPPSAGGQVILTVLNVLETRPPGAPWHDPASLHLYLEASKRAFADRALLGDPAFVPDPTPALVSKERAALLAKAFGERATPSREVRPGEAAGLPASAPPPGAGGSTHTTNLCTVDAAGDAVALTSTVNYSWGAAIVAAGTGVIWNDQLDDFSIGSGVANVYGLVGADANAVAPGKVPLSSMAPTMVFDGPTPASPLRLVIGSPGGPRIPTTVLQAIVAHLDHGADVATALALPRLHHQQLPEDVFVEPFALDPLTAAALTARGHKLTAQRPWSNATAIALDAATGVRTGAADPRGVGVALAE